MKKKICILLALCMVLVSVTCAFALPAASEYSTEPKDKESVGGFYDIGKLSGITITPKTTTGSAESVNADVDDDKTYETLYKSSVKMDVSVSGLKDDSQYLVVLFSGSGDVPTSSSEIYYIDQKSGSDLKTEDFNVYPMDITTDKLELKLLITSNDADFDNKTVPMKYSVAGTEHWVQPYKLGDVDRNNAVDSADASLVLQDVVHLITLDSTQRLAADVDKKNGVDSADASLILQYVVHLITEF